MSPEAAQSFAEAWIRSWNAHDLDEILSHYRDDVEFTSPFVRLMDNPSGTVHGKEALRAYFQRALQAYPELQFQLITVFLCGNSLVLHYHSVLNLQAAEVMELDPLGLVSRTVAHYTNR